MIHVRRQILIALGVVVASLPASAKAQSSAASFTLPQSGIGSGVIDGVDGFEFSPTRNISVTTLGWYDHGGDGLLHSHPVAIYSTSSQTAVVPATVVDSTSTLDAASNFRYASVTPVILNAGTSYTIAGFGNGPTFDPYVANPTGGVTFSSGIDFSRYRHAGGSASLVFPLAVGTDEAFNLIFFGPNFQYVEVPCPSSLTTGLIGIVPGLCLVGRRRSARMRVSSHFSG